MELVKSHCHTLNSDGRSSVVVMASEGIDQGLSHLYITDHHIIGWTTLEFPEYFEEIDEARDKISGKIGLHRGVELDWVNGYEDWFIEESKRPFDFVLGAVHSVGPNRIYAAELPANESRDLTKEYFNQVRRLASSGLADSIAHLDLVKFSSDETEEYYREEVKRTLEVIARSRTAIEINTSGKRKGSKEYNPSNWILEQAFQFGIPLTIGADSHRPIHLTYELKEAYDLARTIGYKTILRFVNRLPIEIPLNGTV